MKASVEEVIEAHRCLGAKETARMLGVEVETLANWRFKRIGPKYVKLGKYVRYQLSEILRWIKANGVDPEAD